MNLDVLEFVQSIWTEPLTELFSLATHLGSEMVVIPLLCILLWCVSKDTGYRLGFVLFISLGLNQTLKILLAVPRPWVRWPGRVDPVPGALADATGYSLPSGHTGMAAAAYPTLAHAMKGRTWFRMAAAGALVTLVALSRVYLGVHTPVDVLVSLLITLAVVVPVNLLYNIVSRDAKRTHDPMVLGIALVAAAIVFFAAWSMARPYGPTGLPAEMADVFKTSGAMAGFAAGWAVERRWIRWNVRSTLPLQVVKVAVGLGVVFMLKEKSGAWIDALFANDIATDTIRYVLLTLWVTAGLPAVAVLADSLFHRFCVRRPPRSC